jgi:hypothetical protein
MTKLAVQNVLDDFLFEDDMDKCSFYAATKSEFDSYFGADETVQDEASRVESLKVDLSAKNSNHAMDIKRVQTKQNGGMVCSNENESASQLADDYSYSDENESASPLGDDCSYFGQEMDVTSLIGSLQADESVLKSASEVESLPVDVPVKKTRKFASAVNVKSLRVKKSVVESLRAKKNEEVTNSKESESSSRQKNDVKSLQTKKNDEVMPSKKNDSSAQPIEDSYHRKGMDVTILTNSKGNESVSRPDEGLNLGKAMDVASPPTSTEKGMLLSSRPDKTSCIAKELLDSCLQQDDEAKPSLSKVNDLGIEEKSLENTEDVVMAVGSSFPRREIDPWYEDDEHHDEEKATKSIKAALTEDPFTFRRKFMLLFLIIGVAAITGGIAAFVTSRHQARSSGGEPENAPISRTIAPSPSPITSEPTAAPTDAPVTSASTSQPTAGTATPTVGNADANIDTLSPSSANTNVDTTAPTSAPSMSQSLSLRQRIELWSPESLPALDNATSPQAQALDWAIQQPNPSLVHFGLATLRYATNSSTGWRNEDGWLTSDVCEWYGIVCRGTKVVKVYLSFNNLGATLPDEVSLLTDLEVLSISGSTENRETKGNLVGTIPSTWGERLVNLSELYAQ